MRITIPMEAIGKGRPRAGLTKEGRLYTYTPEETREAENFIRNAVLLISYQMVPLGVPLHLDVTFYRARPRKLAKRVGMPTSRPDLDNCIKLITDALEKHVYANDSQITTMIARKRFGEPPRIELSIERDEERPR